MNKTTKAREYISRNLQEMMGEIPPVEMEKTRIKMLLASKIDDFMKARGWNKSQFALQMGKNPSEITRWLSGTHNFTIDLLTEISQVLGVDVSALFSYKQVRTVYQADISLSSVVNEPVIKLITPFSDKENTDNNV